MLHSLHMVTVYARTGNVFNTIEDIDSLIQFLTVYKAKYCVKTEKEG